MEVIELAEVAGENSRAKGEGIAILRRLLAQGKDLRLARTLEANPEHTPKGENRHGGFFGSLLLMFELQRVGSPSQTSDLEALDGPSASLR